MMRAMKQIKIIETGTLEMISSNKIPLYHGGEKFS
jgi:hypothetical protein